MNKEVLIEKLLIEKAEKNNMIDLNAYALGLDAMYKALVLYGVIKSVCDKCTDKNGQNIGNMYVCPHCGREVD